MVTVEELKEWSYENGEDVIFDGPYQYDINQYNILTESFSDELVSKFGEKASINDIEEVFEWWYDGGSGPKGADSEVVHDILLQCFADLINKNNLKKWDES